MSAELDALQTQVAETLGAEQSAIALIQGLKAKLDEIIASGDTAALQALRDQLDASEQGLAAAIAANPVP